MLPIVKASLMSLFAEELSSSSLQVLDRGRADEAHLVALLFGEEGDLPPVVAGRLHADKTWVNPCFRWVFPIIVRK